MINRKLWCIAVVATFCISFSVLRADIITPSHSCSKPYRPSRFTSKIAFDIFMDEVEEYKSCIEEFVEEQEDAIKKHREAANEAVEEWNSFVRVELR
jgi:hypothetical protein